MTTLKPELKTLFELLMLVPVNSLDPDDRIARDIIMTLLRRQIASGRKAEADAM